MARQTFFVLTYGRHAGRLKVTRYFRIGGTKILALDITRKRISRVTQVTINCAYNGAMQRGDMKRCSKEEFDLQLEKIKKYLGI